MTWSTKRCLVRKYLQEFYAVLASIFRGIYSRSTERAAASISVLSMDTRGHHEAQF